MRALVVSNMAASRERPGRGVFVRDQVAALARISDIEVELFEFHPGALAYPRAARTLRARFGGARLDIVHAHFGLTAWPALALRGPRHAVTLHGTDVRHPRSRLLTLAAARHMDLVATVSEPLALELGAAFTPPVLVLPCGVALDRFRPIPRDAARLALGLARDVPHLLFPADPARPEKRFDRARELAGGVQLISLGATAPDHVTLAINAANAVLVPSEAEGFGLAVIEALACDVPVLATPVGVHAEALAGIEGTLCAPYDRARWSAALAPLLADPDPRVAGRARASEYSSELMAARVAQAWRTLLASDR
ncbi:MAG TPA: glycosyltransferase [Solirubrobacteraceae bacterium]|nr:glycosyltransferase [Solirubrobacteraceae bacterium]